jgi:hypothetical protein
MCHLREALALAIALTYILSVSEVNARNDSRSIVLIIS